MNMFEKLNKAISQMKNEEIESEIKRIQAEKAKRYEYHKKYNLAKKAFENNLIVMAKKKNLIK